ncbi:hypothetical protein CMUST_00890 [Corynebacterium mustelae]|uniref:BZIP domain-containing protein n=1 Tax=Corynebacterium mustelae TaxID=571915 RepID=A0A0G3GTS4_9CORY|nr:DNA polymerase III subunit epsilon [Corynebacterium mustelae]AKK04529.1 hypothetical protein CMUST_00890 [Corynebacterium mustelae]
MSESSSHTNATHPLSEDSSRSTEKNSTSAQRTRRRRRRRPSGTPTPQPTRNQKSQNRPQRRILSQEEKAEREAKRLQYQAERAEELARSPYIAMTIHSSGIHPSTAHIVAIDALLLSPTGEIVDEYYTVINPVGDPGPQHLHGLTLVEIAEGSRFEQVLKPLGRLIDGRTLIVNNAPLSWGFIHNEARCTMAKAARANRSRNNRNRSRRRHRVGHVPKPKGIIDTLSIARRQAKFLPDIRIRTVARALGLETAAATATVERARQPAADVAREETTLVADMFFHAQGQFPDAIAITTPDTLRADAFGLQRSAIRVDAIEASAQYENPGIYSPDTGLIAGMEVVVAPEITLDPDIIIEAIVAAELFYSEKVTRQTSLVVCNITDPLTGKAMHASRKGIPLISDTDFLELVKTVQPGTTIAPAEAS